MSDESKVDNGVSQLIIRVVISSESEGFNETSNQTSSTVRLVITMMLMMLRTVALTFLCSTLREDIWSCFGCDYDYPACRRSLYRRMTSCGMM
jgi:hypothetical protein